MKNVNLNSLKASAPKLQIYLSRGFVLENGREFIYLLCIWNYWLTFNNTLNLYSFGDDAKEKGKERRNVYISISMEIPEL